MNGNSGISMSAPGERKILASLENINREKREKEKGEKKKEEEASPSLK